MEGNERNTSNDSTLEVLAHRNFSNRIEIKTFIEDITPTDQNVD